MILDKVGYVGCLNGLHLTGLPVMLRFSGEYWRIWIFLLRGRLPPIYDNGFKPIPWTTELEIFWPEEPHPGGLPTPHSQLARPWAPKFCYIYVNWFCHYYSIRGHKYPNILISLPKHLKWAAVKPKPLVTVSPDIKAPVQHRVLCIQGVWNRWMQSTCTGRYTMPIQEPFQACLHPSTCTVELKDIRAPITTPSILL